MCLRWVPPERSVRRDDEVLIADSHHADRFRYGSSGDPCTGPRSRPCNRSLAVRVMGAISRSPGERMPKRARAEDPWLPKQFPGERWES
jgi:hypothetical protein